MLLDGNLLAAKFGADGKLDLEPREHVQAVFSFASDRYRHKAIAIHVVTLAGLSEFLKKVARDGGRLLLVVGLWRSDPETFTPFFGLLIVENEVVFAPDGAADDPIFLKLRDDPLDLFSAVLGPLDHRFDGDRGPDTGLPPG